MTTLTKPKHDVGETVWVLCHHNHFGTPHLLKTTINAVIFGDHASESYTFDGSNDSDRTDAIFREDQEASARVAFTDAITAHRRRRDEARSCD